MFSASVTNTVLGISLACLCLLVLLYRPHSLYRVLFWGNSSIVKTVTATRGSEQSPDFHFIVISDLTFF